ncbi:MAG: pilus assembly PilX N-terminal domain-containing protein [Gemmatimonadales bacterium]
MEPYQFIGSVTRNRRGSALILVLIMTLSLAGLAISAIYLSSSAGLLSRYYDRERNYRYAAEAAIAMGKSRIQAGDTSLHMLDTGAQALLSAASLRDASGAIIPRVLVNLYGANTGDTVGIYGQFVTLLAQAYDSGGTRMVRRLDLTAESFSRFAMFTNTFSSGLAYGPGEFIRGRAHSNQGWYSSGGPQYFDTVSAHTTVNGTATYAYTPISGAPLISMPTIAKLAALTTYASNANLQFAPQTATSGSNAVSQSSGTGSLNLSGEMVTARPTRGTRVSFRPVDVNNNGTFDQSDGMMMIFDAADGIDTSSLRVDLPRSGAWNNTNNSAIVMMNQCGLLMHFIAGQIPAGTGPTFANDHNEFFPVARVHEYWVRQRMMLGTLATGGSLTTADTTAMEPLGADSLPTAAVINNVMSHGVGNSRCFPVGSPLLMLAERHTNAACAIDSTTTTGTSLWGWGATGGACGATKRYGGMDTTFTANVTRCAFFGGGYRAASPHRAGDDTSSVAGKCPTAGTTTGQIKLGSWRPWGGTALPTIPTSVIQPVEAAFLWPLFLPYNMNSKGVINATTGPIYMSDTLRGFITFYESNATQNVVIIDDLVYDQDPTTAAALCRNFLGIIAGQNVLAANNALNRPRPDEGGTVRWYGFPNFTLHAVTMALNGTVGLEDGYSYSTDGRLPGGPATSPATVCGATSGTPNTTSGGCLNQTGGVIEQIISPTFTSGGNTGLRENRTVDPCQKTNSRPPFFPATGRYLDNKYYEIDPTLVATPAQVVTFYQSLRGHVVP